MTNSSSNLGPALVGARTLSSIREGRKAAARFGSVGDGVGEDVGDGVGAPVGDEVGDGVGSSVGDEVGDPDDGGEHGGHGMASFLSRPAADPVPTYDDEDDEDDEAKPKGERTRLSTPSPHPPSRVPPAAAPPRPLAPWAHA